MKLRQQTDSGSCEGEEQSSDMDSVAVLGRQRLGFRVPQVGMTLENTIYISIKSQKGSILGTRTIP